MDTYYTTTYTARLLSIDRTAIYKRLTAGTFPIPDAEFGHRHIPGWLPETIDRFTVETPRGVRTVIRRDWWTDHRPRWYLMTPDLRDMFNLSAYKTAQLVRDPDFPPHTAELFNSRGEGDKTIYGWTNAHVLMYSTAYFAAKSVTTR